MVPELSFEGHQDGIDEDKGLGFSNKWWDIVSHL